MFTDFFLYWVRWCDQWCAQVIFVESNDKPLSWSHLKYFWVESESSHDLVESVSSHKNCRVTSSHWFASSSHGWVKRKLVFLYVFFWYKIAPNMLQNGAQCCSSNFNSKLFRSKCFVKAVSILILSFTLSHFHKSSPTLLQEIYFLAVMESRDPFFASLGLEAFSFRSRSQAYYFETLNTAAKCFKIFVQFNVFFVCCFCS